MAQHMALLMVGMGEESATAQAGDASGLLVRLKARDTAALDAIARYYGSALLRAASLYLGDTHAAPITIHAAISALLAPTIIR